MKHRDVIADTVRLGNLFYGRPRSGFGGEVIGVNGTCFTLSTMSGGYREPIVPIAYET